MGNLLADRGETRGSTTMATGNVHPGIGWGHVEYMGTQGAALLGVNSGWGEGCGWPLVYEGSQNRGQGWGSGLWLRGAV